MALKTAAVHGFGYNRSPNGQRNYMRNMIRRGKIVSTQPQRPLIGLPKGPVVTPPRFPGARG